MHAIPLLTQQGDSAMSEAKTRRYANKKAIITLLAENNPKRQNTLAYDRFDLYKSGMTVAEYLEQGGRSGDINHDVEMGFISLSE
jgi:hypothetical protein